MTERRLPGRYVPVRVLLRPQVESGLRDRELAGIQGNEHNNEQQSQELTSLLQVQHHAYQIKELLRLCDLLRADLKLDDALRQIAATMTRCTGFRVLMISLIDEEAQCLQRVAFAGLSEEDERLLRESRKPVEVLTRAMRPEFRVSQSYFISHEYVDENSSTEGPCIVSKSMNDYEPGGWHPDDALIVPLYSPRGRKLLGFLSLDDPEDGKIPTEESIEIVELFATKAALAIDNARLYQEREAERVALEQGIAALRDDMEQIRHGDLRKRISATHEKLQPVGEAINVMLEEICSILSSMQMVTSAVDEHTRNVQRSSDFLVRDTSQQERQVYQISQAIGDIASMMQQVSERATELSTTALEAVDVTIEAQGVVDRAVDGMAKVREATLQSARTMKTLGESGQEINETILAVNDLTIRMHHLSLNAAIEATRAGEQGKGFAVIAQEIRTLAMQSDEAARKIGAYIRAIQQETSLASQSVEQNTQQVVMQTELVTQTGVALEAVSVVTEQLTKLIQGICATADNQSKGSQLVVGAVGEILHMTADITQHTRDMQQSLNHLVELTNSLQSRLAVFHRGEQHSV